MAKATQERIDRAISRVHPAGVYESPSLNLWDEHLSEARLHDLFHQANCIQFACADVELAGSEMDRSHLLHVGVDGAPNWYEFNREFSERDRLAALREQAGQIVYWSIQISRIGPFWTDYWNAFGRSGTVIVPSLAVPPTSFEWSAVIGNVKDLLARFELHEVDKEMLEAPLPWLATAQAHLLAGRGRPPHPTVRHALFSDLY